MVRAGAENGDEEKAAYARRGGRLDHPVPLLRAKGETEQRLRDTDMAWTVLQPNLFLDKLPVAVVGGPALAGRPVTLVGEGRRQHSLVAMRDVAAFALAALDRSDAAGQTLPLGGPQAVSFRDVVAAFEQELGREVPVLTMPLGQPVPGMPSIVSELLTALETYDSPLDMTDMAAAYPIPLTTLADFVGSFIAAHGRALVAGTT